MADTAPDVQSTMPGPTDISGLTTPAPPAPAPINPMIPPAAPMDTSGPMPRDSSGLVQRGDYVAAGGNPNANTGANPNGPVQGNPGPQQGGQGPTWQSPVTQPKSVWGRIFQGALWGLSGEEGQHGLISGAINGATGQAQRMAPRYDLAVQTQQNQLQMESVKAADAHILAMNQARLADTQDAEAQQSLAEQHLIYQQTMKALGIEPTTTVEGTTPKDIHTNAVGALTTLAQRNGGTIPAVATTNNPAGANDGNHEINVYTTNAGDIKQNPNGNRALVDEVSRIQTGDKVPDQVWTSGGGAMLGKVPNPVGGQVAMVQDAKKFLLPQLPSKDPQQNDATAASNHQQLEAYKTSIGDNPTPQQAAVLKALEAKTDTFDATVASLTAKSAQDQATAAGLKKSSETAAEEAAKIDPTTPAGRLNLQKQQQDIMDKRYTNAAAHQKALFDEGVDPVTGDRLNLSNAPDEALVNQATGQPIPTKMLSTLKPTQQESNRADFAKSALHSLDLIDGLKAQGKLPNGPITGWTTKGLEKAGLNGKDAADAIGLVALTQSAATGAHVGGRFSEQIMDKMNGLLTLNSNDSQFAGQEQALRQVMTPYAVNGGRETVAQYKQSLMGQTKVLNGKTVKVTGFDKNGNVVLGQ